MAVKGKVSEFTGGDFSKKVGVFEGKILAINPDKEELEKLLGTELKRDPEYLKEDSEGNDMISLTLWVEDVKSKAKMSCRIPIIDKLLTTRDGSKTKFVNSQGNVTYWVDQVENVPDWFKAYDNHQAIVGEDSLYSLLRAWFQIDTFHDKTAEISVDLKKIMRNNVKELRSYIGGDFDHTVLFNSTISTKEVEAENGEVSTKIFQNLYNKEFLPGSAIKFFNLGGKFPKFVQAYADQCKYNIKDYFLMEPLQDYDPSKNPVSSDEPKVGAEDDSSY